MRYPKELLPKSSFKPVIDNRRLPGDSSVIRKSCHIDTTTNETGSVRRIEVFGPNPNNPEDDNYKEAFRLSLNLNSIFKTKHLKYKVIRKELNQLWIPQNGTSEITKTDFVIEDPCLGLYLTLSKVHNQPFPYDKGPLDNSQSLTGIVSIEHKPTICNYWHFEFAILDHETKEKINPTKGTWVKNAATAIFNIFLKRYMTRTPMPPCKMENSIYIK